MSTTSAYFIPDKNFPVGQFKDKAKKALEKLKIIDGNYDEEDESYASGGNIAFEYASIHDTGKVKLVPEASSAGYGATCVHCNSDIDEELYETINEYYDFESDSGEEKNMDTLQLTCTKCNTSTILGKIKFTQPVLLANQFFQFVDIDDKIDVSIIKQLVSTLGCDIKLIYERM